MRQFSFLPGASDRPGFLDRVDARGERVGIDENAHRVFLGPENLHLRHAINGREPL